MADEQEVVNNDDLLNEGKQPELSEDTEVNSETINNSPTDAEQDRQAEQGDAVELLQKQLSDTQNDYLRLRAEWDNYRKRSKVELEATKQYALQTVITSLLPVIDNFERALLIKTTTKETETLLQGMVMVQKQLIGILEAEGVKEIQAVGKQFDPYFHQAVAQEKVENKAENEILEVLQKGYTLKERVIRPAMVKVNQ